MRWCAVVDCIADLLGERAEVVLHEVKKPDNSIIKIRNGYITGRKMGGPLTDLGFYMLRESGRRIETLGVYRSRTESGELLTCNAANLRNEEGEIEAILCINILTPEQTSDASLNQEGNRQPEHFQTNITQIMERMVSGTLEQHNLNGRVATREKRLELIQALDARGVFLSRGAVKLVSKALGIASPTVYKYIQEVRKESPN
jgi:predicted transcriptional regulator YheO